MTAHIANPLYAARRNSAPPLAAPNPIERTVNASRTQPVYARLPAAPRNASPVPHLTSLYHSAEAGDYVPGLPGQLPQGLLRVRLAVPAVLAPEAVKRLRRP